MGIGINHGEFQCTHAFLVLYISLRGNALCAYKWTAPFCCLLGVWIALAVCIIQVMANVAVTRTCLCRPLFTRNKIHQRPQLLHSEIYHGAQVQHTSHRVLPTNDWMQQDTKAVVLGDISSIGWLWLKDSLTSFAKPSLGCTTFQDASPNLLSLLLHSGLDASPSHSGSLFPFK